LVPGLLQTADYVRAVARETHRPALSEEEIERRVAVRMERQGRLTADEFFRLWAIVDESVLRRPTGGAEVMRPQLDHLDEMSRIRTVTLQVMPLELGAHVGMTGPLVVLQFPNAQHGDVVYVDTPVGDIFAEDKAQVHACKVAFEHLRASALDEDQSRQRIRRAAEEFSHDRPDRRPLAKEQSERSQH
jgi:hypothetical protein